jgi:cell division cycle protein 20 (cofactor of APC complex)
MSFQEKAPSRRRHCQQPEHSVLGVGIGGGEKSNTKLVSRSIPSVPSRILDAPDDGRLLLESSWVIPTSLPLPWRRQSMECLPHRVNSVPLIPFQTPTLRRLRDCKKAAPILQLEHLMDQHSSGMCKECKQLRSMDGHTDRVGALAWNRHLLLRVVVATLSLSTTTFIARLLTFGGHTQ